MEKIKDLKKHGKVGKLHYAWIVAFSCGMIMLASLLLGATMISIYTVIISEDLGISRSAFSILVMIKSLVMFAANLGWGRLLMKYKLKPLMIIGTALMGAALFTLSRSTNTFMICITGVMIGIASMLTCNVPISIVITNWFSASRGTVMGFVSAFSGIGGVVINPIMSKVIDKYGWRVGFTIMAIACMVIAAFTFLVLKEKPSDKGLEPYGAEKSLENEKTEPGEKGTYNVRFFGSGNRSRDFRRLTVSSLLFALGTLVIFGNITAILYDIGFSMLFATGVAASVASVSNFSGKILMGIVADRLSIKAMIYIWYGLSIAASLFFVFFRTSSTVVAVIGVLIVGIIGAIYSVPVPLVCAKLFPESDAYTKVVSFSTSASALSTAFSGMLFHKVYEITGTYEASLLYTAALAVVCFALMHSLVRRNKEKLK